MLNDLHIWFSQASAEADLFLEKRENDSWARKIGFALAVLVSAAVLAFIVSFCFTLGSNL